jgi:hypothetical protein
MLLEVPPAVYSDGEATRVRKGILADAAEFLWAGLLMHTILPFLWFSMVAGLVAALVDLVQFFRYGRAFPGESFAGTAAAGISGAAMFGASLLCVLRMRRSGPRETPFWLGLSSAFALVLAFLPRPEIGTAGGGEVFAYIGGLGLLATVLLILHPGETPAGRN